MVNKLNADAICVELLSRSEHAYETGDFALFATCFHLPHKVETFEGSMVIACKEELEDVFHRVRDHYRRLGVTQLVRTCILAAYVDNETIHATHESVLMKGDTPVGDSYPCFGVIRRIKGVWLVANSQYAVSDSKGYASALMPRHRVASTFRNI